VHAFDWTVLVLYFPVMTGIGWWATRRVKNAADVITARGKMPWWLPLYGHLDRVVTLPVKDPFHIARALPLVLETQNGAR